MAVYVYRLREVERVNSRLDGRLGEHEHAFEDVRSLLARQQEQISGDGGLQNAVRDLRKDMGDVRRAFYALTGSLIVAAVALTTAIATHAI